MEKNRVEAFSDGVMAIVITLLVFNIKVPQVEATDIALWTALARIAPAVAAWVVSFAFVLVFWISHHAFFSSLLSVDRGILWLNGLFLLCIAFTPFPTALVGDYPLTTPPLALLSGAMFFTALCFFLMRLYVLRAHGLVKPDARPATHRALMRSARGPLLYALGFGAAFYAPLFSVAMLVLVPILFFLPPRLRKADLA